MDKQDDPQNFPPYNWIKDAKIFNHNYQKIPPTWITDGVDAIVLYFSLRATDKDGIMLKFCEIYENAKYNNVPIEVINVPMDETKKDMCVSFKKQANWFTLSFDDPLIITLLYLYDITAVPHLVVIKTDGSVVSSHGILDLHDYGKNALMSWLSNSAGSIKCKRLSKEMAMYGPKWNYLNTGVGKTTRPTYRKKFV